MENHDVDKMIKVLTRLNSTWSKRAAVKDDPIYTEAELNPNLPDYPIELVPFWDHPNFQKHDEGKKSILLSHAWINYNKNTIMAEEKIANPAFALLMNDVFPGTHYESMKRNMIQALVDEHYHTYLHMQANFATYRMRNLKELDLPPSISYRKYLEATSDINDTWKKDLITTLWAVVSEVSINAYLGLLENAKDIQPLNSTIAKVHNRDEYGHASVCFEAAKSMYVHMNKEQRKLFNTYLPLALKAFVAHDYSVWEGTLEQLGFTDVRTIIGDCINDSSKKSLVRDYSGLKAVVNELGIEEEIDFEFMS